VFSMTPTASARGYWLVARDGGIFTFGDAHFYGSTGNVRLNQPIVGITRSPSGRGYRMVAADGGVFSFGDVQFYGSLPGLGVGVRDVVGMAPTPTNKGYWVVRRNGRVYAFGDARNFGSYTPFSCDPVQGIFSNPHAQGFRLVLRSGTTIPFGAAPGGSVVTGATHPCTWQTTCRAGLTTAADYQALFNTRGPFWDGADGAAAVNLGDGRRLWLFGDTYSGPADAQVVLPGFQFVRNTIGVESGNCMEFRLGGQPGKRLDYLPKPSGTEWYWPMDAVVDAASNSVRVSAMRVADAPGAPGYQWKVVRIDIVTLDLRSLAYKGASPMPTGGGLPWGISMIRQGDTVYLYASVNGRHYAARTALTHLYDGKWEFWTSNGWSTSTAGLTPMTFTLYNGKADGGPFAGVTVEPYGSGYIASAKRCDLICPDLSAWYSPSPAGPWHAVNLPSGQVMTTPAPPQRVAYGGHLVPTQAGWIGVWSQNRTDDTMAKYAFGPQVGVPSLPSPAALAKKFPLPSSSAKSAAAATPAGPAPAPAPITTNITTLAPTDIPTPAGWTNH